MNRNKLRAKWSKKENCLEYFYPDDSANGCLLHNIFTIKDLGTYHPSPFNEFVRFFDGSVLDELDRRGYDIKTLKFSIERKKWS